MVSFYTASYSLFSAGASGSASRSQIIETQRQVCTSGFNSSSYSNTASSYAKTVYQGSLDAWNRCQELATQNLNFNVQPSSTMQGLSVSISVPSGYAAVFYGISQFGAGRSQCDVYNQNGRVSTFPIGITAANLLTINCARQMQSIGNDLIADAQDLVFMTSRSNLTVPLAAIGNLSRATVDQLTAQITAKASPVGTVAAFNLTSCPSGWSPANGTNGNPDLRGVFIRGLDNGRSIDPDSWWRYLRSYQDDQLQNHTHRIANEYTVQTVETVPAYGSGTHLYTPMISDRGSAIDNYPDTTLPRGAKAGTETRPKNVALLYCVKN